MNAYEKISNIFKRDEKTKKLIIGDYITDYVEFLSKVEWVGSEKIDGTNIGILWDGYSIHFQGRTEKSQLPKHLESRLTEIFQDAEEIFEELFGNQEVIIFGEGYGKGIQKGEVYKADGTDFIVFDIYFPQKDLWLEWENIVDIANRLNLKVVPIIFIGTLEEAVKFVQEKPKSEVGNTTIEGIVARPKYEMRDRQGNRVAVKIKCRDFEVKE